MREKTIFKTISIFTVAIFMATLLLVLICPQITVPRFSHGMKTPVAAASLCPGGFSLPDMGQTSGCVNSHLATAVRYLNSLFTPSVLLLIIGVATLSFIFATAMQLGRVLLKATSWRGYLAVIRARYLKKFIAWLSIFNSHFDASIA